MHQFVYCELKSERVRADARLFANRYDLVSSMTELRGGVIAEVGVANGEFSNFILRTLEPSKFVAFDTFGMHQYPSCWGIPTEVMFKGMTHLDFYKDRFGAYGDRVVAEQGLSYDTVPRYPDHFFDMMYIDAGHDYEDVARDASIAIRKTKPNGTIVFNDYIMYSHLSNEPYGVIRAVNELLVEHDWQIVGFALHRDMYCDVAVKRRV
ncbi:hypothetical protein AWB70_06249 [Caballeronia cordobensis]|uniref:Class I SAM-dependent methyltransferase n=1 Tax=Caballeronia cordobensis TaxID=1353886 RepID=A0A158JB92_CABCO|nr:class I SAM-dependent methyltransferase [Caballeronia cordobensis]SAL66154.1 hypothetical protein AWB70_06249 [Caballeronia cordobensis]